MFSHFQLADQHVTPRGAKTCALSAHGAKVAIQPCTQAVLTPFPPGNFDKDPAATRLTLELRCTPEMVQYFDAFDLWAKEYLLAHSERLFLKVLSQTQIEEGYHPTVKRHAKWDAQLRTKLDTVGRREVTYWTPEGVRRTAPEDWSRVTVLPKLEISNLWIMGREIGWVIQATALQVFEESVDCPFALSSAGGVNEETSPW